MGRSSSIVLVLAVVLLSCREKPAQEAAVARIDNRILTMQDIRAQFDSTSQPSEAQVQQFLRRWVADELLYREAVRRGLHQTPDVTRRADELRRQLVIQTLLEDEIYSSTVGDIGAEEIAGYYEDHRAEFTLSERMVLVSHALFEERNRATSFRNLILRNNASWNDALADSAALTALISRTDSVYHTEASFWPRELWRVATTIRQGSPSFPIGTNDGYYVVYVWKAFTPGMPADLRSVEPDIRNRLTVERRQRAYRSLVENLRSRYAVETYLSPTFGDTTLSIGIPQE